MSRRTPLMFFLGLAAVMFGWTPTATADVLTVQFQGVVDKITGGDDLDGSVAVGDEFTGSYTFDTARPPDHVAQGAAHYTFTSPQQRFIVTIGDYTWRSTDNWTCAVYDNSSGRDAFDEDSDYIVVEQTAGHHLPDQTYFALQFSLSTTRNLSAITSTAVPRTIPNPSLFETNYLSISGGRDSHNVLREIRGRFAVPVVSSSLKLPYEGSVSKAGQAFRVNNTYTGATKSYGGWFEAAGAQGRGVYGRSTSTASDVNNYGGFFYAAGPRGRGLFGQSAGATEGIGVKGWASNTGNIQNFGGHFCATGQQGIGVYGWAENTANAQNYGGYFLADGGKGIGAYAIGAGGIAGQFAGNVKVSGAGGALVFPDGTRQSTASGSGSTGGGAYACATPAYDSGWVSTPLGPLTETFSQALTHNLGGNLDKYVVEVRRRVSGWGNSILVNQGLGDKFYYSSLTTSSITVTGPKSAADAYVAVRIRIWVYQ